MKTIGFGNTDKGLVRSNNEDNFFVDAQMGLFIVADGMGGVNAGEVASKMAVDVIGNYIRRSNNSSEPFTGEYKPQYSEPSNRLSSGIWLANKVIEESSRKNPSWNGMGTTIVAGLVKDGRLSIAHVGDSRAYLIRSNTITQITDDHSLVAEQFRQGLITKEEAAESKVKNIITRALGKGASVEVDINELTLADNDVLVMSSDGLTNMVEDDTILAVAGGEESPETACNRLIGLANQNGGKDNITVVVVRIKGQLMDGVKKILSKLRR